MTCNKPIWILLKECAEKLTREGRTPFTRTQLIDCVHEKHPDKGEGSLHPIIQGITVNLKGGAQGGTGKNVLFSVARGRFVLYDQKKHGDFPKEEPEEKGRDIIVPPEIPFDEIYPPGEDWKFYRDLKKIIGYANKSVFIIDPYMNEEIFDYLDKVSPGIQDVLRKVVHKFCRRQGTQLEARHSRDFHDRVIFIDDEICWVLGHSIGVIRTKPTSIVQLKHIAGIKYKIQHEKIWTNASSM
jgi:hypothetical protein